MEAKDKREGIEDETINIIHHADLFWGEKFERVCLPNHIAFDENIDFNIFPPHPLLLLLTRSGKINPRKKAKDIARKGLTISISFSPSAWQLAIIERFKLGASMWASVTTSLFWRASRLLLPKEMLISSVPFEMPRYGLRKFAWLIKIEGKCRDLFFY